MELQNGQYFGRLFSYPQGIASFFPTLLTLVAVVANFWMFWDKPAFICWQTEINFNGQKELNYGCSPLYITNPTFWDERDDDMQYAPLQAAAVMAVVSAVAGGIIFVLLLSASCFELQPCKLLFLMIAQFVCAVFTVGSIFVATGVDPCKDLANCERYQTTGLRLAEGSVAAVFAAFFYGWAAFTVLSYRSSVVRANNASRNVQQYVETQQLIPQNSGVKHVSPPAVVPVALGGVPEDVEFGHPGETDSSGGHDMEPSAAYTSDENPYFSGEDSA